MVKRKVDISIDEWLEERVSTSQSNVIQTNTNQESSLPAPPPTDVESPTEVTDRTPTGVTADGPMFDDQPQNGFGSCCNKLAMNFGDRPSRVSLSGYRHERLTGWRLGELGPLMSKHKGDCSKGMALCRTELY